MIRATLSTRAIFTAPAHTHTRRFGTDVKILDATSGVLRIKFPDTLTGSCHFLNGFGWSYASCWPILVSLENVKEACTSSVLRPSHSPPHHWEAICSFL